MAIPNRQIGWSQKANLLWEISKQLERLTQVAGSVVINPITTTTTTTNLPGINNLSTENNDLLITEGGDFIILN
jgi:hypothetical protein